MLNATLNDLFEHVPSDLLNYFEQIENGSYADQLTCGVNLFPLQQAVKETLGWRRWYPLMQVLGGVVLDDANTSNHHIYLSAPGCAGSVFYLNHDGSSHVVFTSLAEFLSAAHAAIESHSFLEDLHPEAGVLLPDQQNLWRLLTEAYEGTLPCDDPTLLICGLMGSLAIVDVPLLRKMALDGDFFLGEAIGETIESRPARTLEPLARLLTEHPHRQVVNAGERALQVIARLET